MRINLSASLHHMYSVGVGVSDLIYVPFQQDTRKNFKKTRTFIPCQSVRKASLFNDVNLLNVETSGYSFTTLNILRRNVITGLDM